MKYEFIGKNLDVAFHSFEQVKSATYEKFVLALSIYDAVLNYCEETEAREMMKRIVPADTDLLGLDYDDTVYYLEDLDLYFEIFIDCKRQKSTVWVYSTDCPIASVYEAKTRRAR